VADLLSGLKTPAAEGAVPVKTVETAALAGAKKGAPAAGEEGLAVASGPKKARAGAEPTAPKVVLTDLRKQASRNKEATRPETSPAPADAVHAASKEKVVDLDLHLDASNALGQGERQASLDTGTGRYAASPVARDFSSVMADRLKEAWNGDIVQSAQILLREGDAGTIRLRLHPDSLGGVKIELKLADNNISGKIIVESDAAKAAFERNLGQLQEAFKQGGFETAQLDVQVGGGKANGQGGGEGRAAEPFWSERRGIASLSTAVPELGPTGGGTRPVSGVDIFA
jgi:flagellar hook-length control protein FliK